MPQILNVESEALNWLGGVISEPLEDSKTFQENLKDGTILCKAFNKLFPEYKIKYNCTSMPFKQMENIASFLHGLSVVPGIRTFDLFTTVDLYEGKNLEQVKRCILAFKRIAEKNRIVVEEESKPVVKAEKEEEFIEIVKEEEAKTEEDIEEEEFVNLEHEPESEFEAENKANRDNAHDENDQNQEEDGFSSINEDTTEPEVVLYEDSDGDVSEFHDVFHTSTESQKEVEEAHEIFTVENPGTFEIEISN